MLSAAEANARIVLSGEDRTGVMWESARRNIAGLEESVKSAGARFGTLGVAVATALTGASIKGAVDIADQLDDMAEKTGIAVEELSALRYAGEVVGTPLGSLSTGVKKLTVNMAEAAAGGKSQIALFKSLGVEIKNTDGTLRSTDAVLADVAQRFATFRDGPEKGALAIKTFGKAGEEMIPLLNQGKAGLAALRSEAADLNLIVGGDLAKSSAQFNDNLKRLSLVSEGAKLAVVNNVLSPLNQLTAEFIRSRREGDSFIVTLSRLVAEASKLGAIPSLPHMAAGWINSITGKDRETPYQRSSARVESLSAELQRLQQQAAEEDGGGRSLSSVAAAKRREQRVKELERSLAEERTRLAGIMQKQREAVEPEAERLEREFFGGRTAAPIVPEEDAKKGKSAYEQLNEQIARRLQLAEREYEYGGKLTAADRYRLDAMGDVASKSKELTDEQRVSLVRMIGLTAQYMQAEEERAQVEKAALAMAQARADLRNADNEAGNAFLKQQREADNLHLQSLRDRVKSMAEEEEALGVAARLNVSLAEAIEMVAIQRANEKLERLTDDSSAAEQVRSEIEQRQKLLALMKNSREHNGYVDMLTSAGETGRQVFTDLQQNGVDAFKRIGSTLKSAVADVLYTMTLKPIIVQVAGYITGAPQSAIQQAMGAGQGGGAGWMNNSGLIGAGVQALTGASVGASAASLGVANAVGMAGGDALGALIAANGSWAGVAAGGGAAAAGAGAGAAAGGAGLMGTIGMAIPYIGLAMAVISLIAGSTKGEKRSGGQYTYDPATGVSFLRGPSGGDPSGDQAKALVDSSVRTINGLFESLGLSTRVDSAIAGYEGSEKGRGGVLFGGTTTSGKRFGEDGSGSNYEGTFFEQTSAQSLSAEEAIKNLVADSYQGIIQAWQTELDVLPDFVRTVLEGVDAEGLTEAAAKSIVERISAAGVAFQQFRAAVALMPFEELRSASAEVAQALGDAAGGMDRFLSGLSSYYENFFTAEEKRRNLAANLSAQATALGLSYTPEQILGASRADFRALVESVEGRTDEEGRKLYAALLSLNGAFAQLVEAVPEATETIADMADAQRRATDTALRSLNDAVGIERQIAETQRQLAQERIESLAELRDMLRTGIGTLASGSDMARQAGARRGRAFITSSLQAARATGYLPDSQQLGEAVDAAIAGMEGKRYGSRAEREFDRLTLMGQLKELQDLTGVQLDAGEQQLAAADEQLRLLDETLDYWRQQVDLSQGIHAGVLELSEAVFVLATSLGKSLAGTSLSSRLRMPAAADTGGGLSFGGGSGAGATGSVQQAIANLPELVNANLDRPHFLSQLADSLGLTSAENVARAMGFDDPAGDGADRVRRYFVEAGIPKFAYGGRHAGGYRIVGEGGGPELEYTLPSYIYSAPDTTQILGGQDDVVRAINGLRRDMFMLRVSSDESAGSLRKMNKRPLRVRDVGAA